MSGTERSRTHIPAVSPDRLLEPVLHRVAASVVPLLLEPRSWVHRRVESIDFLDAAIVRRRVSIDFSIPRRAHIPTRLATGQQIAFVPIALLGKKVLRNFDLIDESGRVLPMLTQHQNGAISTAILRRVARTILRKTPDPHIAEDLHDLVEGQPDAVKVAWQHLSNPSGPGSHADRRKLWSDDRFRTLARDLAGQFILFVPLEDREGSRRVLKFSYEEDFRPSRRALPQFLGLSPVRFGVLAPTIGMAESYHIEVASPDELMIDVASLYEFSETAGLDKRDSEYGVSRTHLHVTDATRGAIGFLDIRFRLRRSGITFAAGLIGLVTTGVLGSGWLLHREGIRASPDVAAVLIVALPGLFATYLARPGEHGLVKRLVGGLRMLILGLAVCSFVADSSLAIDISGYARSWIWGICCVVAALGTLVLWTGLGFSKGRDVLRAWRSS